MENVDRATYYANMADRMARDPISEDQGRATVAMGRGFQKWRRFNPGGELIWVVDADGKDRALTRKQADLLDLLLTFVDNGVTTIRSLARTLKCAPSTVSRGIVKLASFGLIATLTGRGRHSGTVVFRLPKDRSLDRFRQAAKAKVRAWSQAAERRLSRLQANVAPYFHERVRGSEVDSLYYYLSTVSKGATLTPWTAEDMAEIR